MFVYYAFLAGPNVYPIPTLFSTFFRYPTRLSFENHRLLGNTKYWVLPDIAGIPNFLGLPGMLGVP